MQAFRSTCPISIILSAILATMPVWGQGPSPVNATVSADSDALQIRVLNPDSLQPVLHSAAKEGLRVEVLDGSGTAIPDAAVICRLPDSGATGAFADGSHAALAYTDAEGRATIQAIAWGDTAGSVPIRLTATKGTAHNGILLETSLATSMAMRQSELQQTATPVSQTVVSVPSVSVTEPPAQPGQLAKPSASAGPGTENASTASTTSDPTVSVTRTPSADAPHSSHAKWYILLAVAAAAGAGAAFSMKGKSSTAAATTTSSVTIGTPTISIGHP